jgi:hypothetical protein
MDEAKNSEALNELAKSKGGCFRDHVQELKKKHETIVGLTRLMVIPNTLDRSIRTRDAGFRVVLA